MNDFPVLKAFQEYIEAEQARARKRTLGLSIFFIVLLVVVVVTFAVIMAAVINRDQQSLQAIATRNQAVRRLCFPVRLRLTETVRRSYIAPHWFGGHFTSSSTRPQAESQLAHNGHYVN